MGWQLMAVFKAKRGFARAASPGLSPGLALSSIVQVVLLGRPPNSPRRCCRLAVAAGFVAHYAGAVSVVAGDVVMDAPEAAAQALGELVACAP